MCIVYAVPLEKRAQIQGLFGSIFGIASIVGPLIGGAFTSNVTWRWCFYINLPFGGVAVAIIVLCLKVPDRDSTKLAWKNKLSQLDALGTVVLISCMVCLLLALQWGGQSYAVRDPIKPDLVRPSTNLSPVEQRAYYCIVNSHGCPGYRLYSRSNPASQNSNDSPADP